MGRKGLQNGKIAGPKLFAAPPPPRQGETFCTPFNEWKLFAPPPFIMVKTSSNYPKTFCAPPFVGVKLHVPPLPF